MHAPLVKRRQQRMANCDAPRFIVTPRLRKQALARILASPLASAHARVSQTDDNRKQTSTRKISARLLHFYFPFFFCFL